MVSVYSRILGSVHREPRQWTEACIVLDEAPWLSKQMPAGPLRALLWLRMEG
jgi:hypothetical protein